MRTLRTAALLTVAGSTFWAMGCVSVDRHVYQAPQTRDGTLTIVDVDTHEELWRQNIPAGQKLVIDLDRLGAHESAFASQGVPANEIEWWLYPAAQASFVPGFTRDEPIRYGQQDLPGTPVLLVYRLGAAGGDTGWAPEAETAPADAETGDRDPADEAQPDDGDGASPQPMDTTAPADAEPEAQPEADEQGTMDQPVEPADAIEPEPADEAPAAEEPVLVK